MAAQRTNNFNIARNRYARRSRSDPYPKLEDVYRRSDTFNHTDGFTDLYTLGASGHLPSGYIHWGRGVIYPVGTL